jgi:hypothetical protein
MKARLHACTVSFVRWSAMTGPVPSAGSQANAPPIICFATASRVLPRSPFAACLPAPPVDCLRRRSQGMHGPSWGPAPLRRGMAARRRLRSGTVRSAVAKNPLLRTAISTRRHSSGCFCPAGPPARAGGGDELSVDGSFGLRFRDQMMTADHGIRRALPRLHCARRRELPAKRA